MSLVGQFYIADDNTDLLKLVQAQSSEIIFMNLPIELCIANAKARPWEPHKYDTNKRKMIIYTC